jgi:uncharacterized protein
MDIMASHVQRREPAARVMEWVAAQDAMRSPNAPCPCGNGREFANCHGADASKSIRQGEVVNAVPPIREEG